MAKIIEFKLPEPKPLTPEQLAVQILSSKEAVDHIVSSLICHVVPRWIESKWPLYLLDIMVEELRAGLEERAPDQVYRYQVDAMIEDIKPVWNELTDKALRSF